MRTTEMISAPISVRQTLPTPPVIAVPPTTTAAIDGSSSSFASVGEPLASRPARMTPAKAAKAPDRMNAITFWRSDLDARGIGRGLAGPDGGAVAAEAGAALDEVGDDEDDERRSAPRSAARRCCPVIQAR